MPAAPLAAHAELADAAGGEAADQVALDGGEQRDRGHDTDDRGNEQVLVLRLVEADERVDPDRQRFAVAGRVVEDRFRHNELGGFAVELAAMRGLRVVGAAGDDDEKLVRHLGAAEFVPRSADLAAAVRELVPGGVDAVFDAAVVGYLALDAIRAGGAFAAFVGTGPVPLRGIRVVPVTIHADGAALTALSSLATAGEADPACRGHLPAGGGGQGARTAPGRRCARAARPGPVS